MMQACTYIILLSKTLRMKFVYPAWFVYLHSTSLLMAAVAANNNTVMASGVARQARYWILGDRRVPFSPEFNRVPQCMR